jgi:hypothetical protein
MKQYYTNNTLFVSSLILSERKAFKDVFGFGNSSTFAFFIVVFFTENVSAQCSFFLLQMQVLVTTGLSPCTSLLVAVEEYYILEMVLMP